LEEATQLIDLKRICASLPRSAQDVRRCNDPSSRSFSMACKPNLATLAFAAALLPFAAQAGMVRLTGTDPAATSASDESRFVIGGSRNGMNWQARSTVIGQTATSDVGPPPTNTIGGGDPIYMPGADKNGVVALIMEYSNGDRFICSGSLLKDGRSIATAGHCVSDGAGTVAPLLTKTTAYFFAGDADVRTPFQVGGTAIDVSDYFVRAAYTGEVIDQNDIAVLRLETEAPTEFLRYELDTRTDLTGEVFNVAGYGTRSTVGGATGNTAPTGARTGFLREGDNRYDYAWGDALFNGFFTDRDGSGENFFGLAEVEHSFVSDFDNGLQAQNQSRRIANALGLGPIGDIHFNDVGLGDREVGIAGGDSGGPGFIDGKLASINSYGLTFGASFGDYGGGLNAGWGEFSGYVPIYLHASWINGLLVTGAVPAPQTLALVMAALALTGVATRRRSRLAAATA
jgi:Trypsin